MCIQSIQRKKCLCKLISATFLANSIGLPTTFAAEAVDTSVSNTDIKDENGLPTIKGNNEDRKYPSWYFHADGTPLTEAELKQRNYKESYSSVEIARIYELLNTYGLEKVQKMQFNVSFRQNPDGSTTIDVNDKANNNPTKGVEFGKGKDGSTVKPGTTPTNSDKEKQLNPTTDGSGTAPTDTKTVPTCDANSELVGGVCMLKCAAGSTRNAADKLCHVTSCPSDSIFNADKTACTACPTGEIPDASQTKCVKKTVDCGENEIYADNDKTFCKACPVGTKPNAAQTSCEDVTCGENEIYADENKRTCKVCPTDTVPNADQTECVEKTTPAKPSVTPTVTCDAEKGEYKGADGTCQTCPTGQKLNDNEDGCVAVPATTECKDGQEKWKDACVDKCKDGETRNQTTGVCAAAAATETPSSSGGGSKSGIGKSLAGVAGLAALASLFGGGGSGGCTGDQCKGPGANSNQKQILRQDVINASETAIRFYAGEETAPTQIVKANDDVPYSAVIDLGKVLDTKFGDLKSLTVTIADTDIRDVPFESGKRFVLIPHSLEAGNYNAYIKVTYVDANQNAHTGTYKFVIPVNESINSIGDDGKDFAILGVKNMTDAELRAQQEALEDATVVSAKWDGGFCVLTLKGGTFIGEKSNQAAPDGQFKVASQNIVDQEQCESIPAGAPASFSNLYLDYTINSSGILVDDGEMTVNNNEYFGTEKSYDVMIDRLEKQFGSHDYGFFRINQTGGDLSTSTGIVYDYKEKVFRDYAGNKLNEEQMKIAIQGLDVDNLSQVMPKTDADGNLVSLINTKTGEEMMLDDSQKDQFNDELKALARKADEYATDDGQQDSLSRYNVGRIEKTNPLTGEVTSVTDIFGVNTNYERKTYGIDKDGGDTTVTRAFKKVVEKAVDVGVNSSNGVPKTAEGDKETPQSEDAPSTGNQENPDNGQQEKDNNNM